MAQTTLAAALTQAGVVSSNFVYFDLMDDLDDRLSNGELKARVFSSLAWNMDMTVINTARSLFYDAYRETTEVNTIDAFNTFMMNVRDMSAAGQHSHDIGFENTASYDQLVNLLNMRHYWHDFARASATREYKPKTLLELMTSEKQQAVSSLDRQKLSMLAEFAADGDSEQTKQMLSVLIERQDIRFKDAFEVRRKIAPSINAIIMRATDSAAILNDGQCPHFHMLPLTSQQRFTRSGVSAIERALSDMGTMRSITMMEFALYLKEGGMAMKALNEVLKAPKFRDL